MRALEAANRMSRLTLVVDQLEEPFTLCSDELQRARFFDELLRGVGDVGLAASRLLRPLHGARRARLRVSANHVLLGPMTQSELQRAIAEPARVAGCGASPASSS